MSEHRPEDERVPEAALTAQGALLIADSAVYDPGDMYRIALKTLAHEYRVMRAKADRLERRVDQWRGIAGVNT